MYHFIACLESLYVKLDYLARVSFTQSGQPQPEPDVAVTVGQDTLSKVEGITYSAAVQVIDVKYLCLW